MTITLTSTTSTEEQMRHAVGENWRTPPAEQVPVDPNPVDTETPEEQVAAPEAAAESEPAEKESKPKSRAQRAIDKLTARNHRLEAELEETRKKVPSAEKPAAPAPQGPPKLDDFLKAGKTADDWADARDQWKAAEETRQAAAEEQRQIFDTYNRGVSEARAKYEDWDETVEAANYTIPQSAGFEIFEMGAQGADVAYYLAKNPEVCEELMELTPIAAKHAVRKIAADLLADTSEQKRSPSKTKVTPPAPLAPVSASSTRSSTPLAEMSPREYIRVRNKQERDRKLGR
jgi:hypothetical protein